MNCCLLILLILVGMYLWHQCSQKSGLNNQLAFDSVETDYMADGSLGKGMPISAANRYGGNSLMQLDSILHGQRGY